MGLIELLLTAVITLFIGIPLVIIIFPFIFSDFTWYD